MISHIIVQDESEQDARDKMAARLALAHSLGYEMAWPYSVDSKGDKFVAIAWITPEVKK